MKDNRPKLIVTEETTIEARELLEMWWFDQGRKIVQKLEPGEWDGRDFRDFRNDIIEHVKVPGNATAVFYEDSEFGRRSTPPLTGGEYDMETFGLKRRVSSVQFALDAWDEIRRDLGRTMSKEEQGDPIIIKTDLSGFPGTTTEQYVDFEESEQESTNWHVNSSITASVEVGGEAQGYKVGLSSTTEAGGGGDETSGEGRTFGSRVGATLPAPPEEHMGDPAFEWQATITSIARRYRVKQEIVRVLRNNRTGEETTQTGVLDAKKLEVQHTGNLMGMVLRVVDE